MRGRQNCQNAQNAHDSQKALRGASLCTATYMVRAPCPSCTHSSACVFNWCVASISSTCHAMHETPSFTMRKQCMLVVHKVNVSAETTARLDVFKMWIRNIRSKHRHSHVRTRSKKMSSLLHIVNMNKYGIFQVYRGIAVSHTYHSSLNGCVFFSA